MLNNKAGWPFVAIAVLEVGLPILELSDKSNAATERVCEMARFAEAMACWLERFSASMVKHQQTDQYQAAREYSSLEIPKANRGVKPQSHGKSGEFHCD